MNSFSNDTELFVIGYILAFVAIVCTFITIKDFRKGLF